MRILLTFVVMLFFGSIISLFQLKSYVQDVNKELINIQNSIMQVKDEIHSLKAEWSYLNRPDRLERLSIKYLHNRKVILANQVFSNLNDLKHQETVVAQSKKNYNLAK